MIRIKYSIRAFIKKDTGNPSTVAVFDGDLVGVCGHARLLWMILRLASRALLLE
jgi:hypothetical protein